MKKLAKAYTGLILVFLYLPIFVLIAYSFNESKSRAVFTGFTFRWYKELFSNQLILSSLANTLIVAAISSVIATVLGTASAIGIHAMGKRARAVVMNVTYLPVVNPEIVTGVSLMLLFVYLRTKLSIPLEMGLVTLVLAHITFNVPYVILNVMPKLRQMDRHIYEAALDLGCSPFQAFFKVVVPEIMPGILSGFLMALTYSLDDFIISYFVSGPTSQTLPVTIYSMTRKKVSPEINALSTIIFLVVLAALVLMNVADARAYRRKMQKQEV